MLLAAIVFAAIMTEKNGTFADAPAGAAVSVPSAFIPYGTYTGGSGSTEYMRVGTNLVGAVASLIDGLWERVAIPYGFLPGEYPFREDARDTKRILATALNFDGVDDERGVRAPLERTLADGYVYETWSPGPGGVYTFKTNAIHAGIAGSYTEGCVDGDGVRWRRGNRDPVVWSSRKADNLIIGADQPPRARSWSGRLPFLRDETNQWRRVFPVYSAYEYDPHFFPSNDADKVARYVDYYRPHLSRWMQADHVAGIWGDDVYGALGDGTGWALADALSGYSVATNALMEEVLKIDPGFEYNYPPQLTNDYWTVSGPLGSFELHHYEEAGVIVWWNNIGDISDYYVELTYYPDDGSWRFFIGLDPFMPIYRYQTNAEKESEYLDLGEYHAQHIQLYADTDDYTHWRNGTTRLDWKRLGIIAQLERHMEITYRAREREDYLPLWEFYVRAHRHYAGYINLHIKIADGAIAEAYVVGHKPSSSLRYVDWTATGDSAEVETNRISASYPTARTIVNLDGSQVHNVTTPAIFSGVVGVRDDFVFQSIADAMRNAPEWPSGSRRFRADMNIDASGIAFGTIFIWYSESDVRSFSVGSAPFFYFNVPDLESEDVFHLSRDDAKIARDVTTRANNATQEYRLMGHDIPAAYPEVMAEAEVTNLEARLWGDGYIKQISLPTLEVRLAASNDYWASQLDAEPVMPYLGEFLETNADIRAFRYQCDVADSSSLDDFRGDRLIALRDLDSEVKKHFQRFAGRAITTGLAPRAAFNAAEIAAFDRAIANANAGVSIVKKIYGGADRTWIEGTFDFDDGWQEGDVLDFYSVAESGATNTWQIVYSTTNYVTHPYGVWEVAVSAQADAAITNSGIRVDGHQNQMMKTLWKFKNMRDPNL